jgi:hypothetical protein
MSRRRGEFTIQLDKPRTWRLRWKDAKAIEDALSQTNGDKQANWMAFRAKMQDWSVDDYAIVIWAGVRHEMPSIEPSDILEIADWTVQDEFAHKFAESLKSALPDDVKKKVEDKQKAMLKSPSKD